jgi:NifU-like protein involved in Fe-S cluster formation
MPPENPYSEAVRCRFANPVHAGALKGAYAMTLTGDAALQGDPCRVSFFAGVADGRLAEMRFHALGCPHLIAAADWLCSELQGRPVSALANLGVNRLMDKLSIPEEKSGRIFLLEDALASIGAQFAAIQETD